MKNKPRALPLAAPLLFWLLVVCGLAGVTFFRMNVADAAGTATPLGPLWIGSLLGVAVGQGMAFARLRVWVPTVVLMGASWLLPPFLFVAYGVFGHALEPFAIAFLPAVICGYLSLSERAGIVAFWYPAVLWMVAILDGPAGAGDETALDLGSSLPLVVGLGALFIAFLRARESRRVAIWLEAGAPRLATDAKRSVERSSPVRSLASVVWTGAVGLGALVLAAWIAPHVWQKEHAWQERVAIAAHARAAAEAERKAHAASGTTPCCPERRPTKRARVKEYLPLVSGRDEEAELELELVRTSSCQRCRNGEPVVYDDDDGAGSRYASSSVHASGLGATSGGNGGGYRTEGMDDGVGTSAGGSVGANYPYAPTPAAVSPPPPAPQVTHAPTPIVVAPPEPPPPPAPPTPAVRPEPKRHVASPAPAPSEPPAPAKAEAPSPIAAAPAPAHAPFEPWRFVLGACVAFVVVRLGARALRRSLTLAHLEKPFWPESLDQRVSNHWQRMLVGLRDAGIEPKEDEQPTAFARRIGLEGMAACAETLERVRHGVRIGLDDLDAMHTASSAAYRAARARAGAAARAISWLRPSS